MKASYMKKQRETALRLFLFLAVKCSAPQARKALRGISVRLRILKTTIDNSLLR